MSTTATITVPTKNGGTRDVSGKVVFLQIGDKKIKFLIHPSEGTPGPKPEMFLTHYGSGLWVGSLTNVKTRYMALGHRINDRGAAKELIQDIINRHGVDVVLNRIANAAPRSRTE